MKLARLSRILVLAIAVLFAWSSGAMAGGGGAFGNCWQVKNPGNGALALKATIAVVYTPTEDFTEPGNVDAVLRVQRGSDQAFYRINLSTCLHDLSDEEIGNRLLNTCVYGPNEQGVAEEVQNLVNEITGYFFGAQPREMMFVITSHSVSDTDYNGDETVRAIEGTGRAASIADITLYAVPYGFLPPTQ